MNEISLTPYKIVQNKDYLEDSKIVIKASNFTNLSFQEGKFTFIFIGCLFKKLEIENSEIIDFEKINILFTDCFIYEINIKNIVTTNLSISFGNSILKGKIENENLKNVSINNCFPNNSLFLLNLKSVTISYTDPIRWEKLLKSSKVTLEILFTKKRSFNIRDCKEITFTFNENKTGKVGFYKELNKIAYYLNEEEKKKFNISLSINYSADKEHTSTKIINAQLSALSISGYSTGKLAIENCKIDNWYISEFSTQLGANFYNIRPFRKEVEERKLEIKNSNLDKVLFNNIAFNDYSIISFYRNRFGQTTFTACDFPSKLKEFDKIKIIENIHYPDKKDKNYFKIRYETFLQLKKVLEASGNVYETLKLQAVSNEELKRIEDLSFWDKVILYINSFSNNHGLSIKRPFLGIFISSAFFYILYLWSLERIFNHNDIDFNLIGYYFSFLDITHRTDFLVSKAELNGWSVFIDYLNKIVTGFFIYQFIAAFRKYGKK